MQSEINYPISNLLRELTCKVSLSGAQLGLLRLALAKFVIRVGVAISGMNGKVEIE